LFSALERTMSHIYECCTLTLYRRSADCFT